MIVPQYGLSIDADARQTYKDNLPGYTVVRVDASTLIENGAIHCVTQTIPAAQTAVHSCAGSCGDKSPDGCWCDSKCTSHGDCCADYQSTYH